MTEINGSDILIFINGRIETECKLCESLFLVNNTPLSTGSLYPKFRKQTSGIIQKLYETKTNTNTG